MLGGCKGYYFSKVTVIYRKEVAITSLCENIISNRF